MSCIVKQRFKKVNRTTKVPGEYISVHSYKKEGRKNTDYLPICFTLYSRDRKTPHTYPPRLHCKVLTLLFRNMLYRENKVLVLVYKRIRTAKV